jgi:hypothetical protein
MIATRLQKRVALHKSNPLQEPGILHRVLECCGLGQWLFIALVNSEWKLLYESLSSHKVDSMTEERTLIGVECDVHTTLASAAFGSVPRTLVAHKVMWLLLQP